MLKDIVVPKEEVKIGDVSFEIQGLSIETIVRLCKSHLTEMERLFDGTGNIAKFIAEAPEFVARVIAEAADEPREWKKVRSLPAGVQVEAIKKIWAMTQITKEDLGNAIRGFSDLMGEVNQVFDVNAQSSNDTSNSSPKPQIISSDQDILSET